MERNSSRGQITSLPPNYATWMEFLKYVFGICGCLRHIKLEKEKHVWASQVMEDLVTEYYKKVFGTAVDMNEPMSALPSITETSQEGDTDDGEKMIPSPSKTDDGEKMTPFLTAAKKGVIVLVKKISDDGEIMTPLLTAAENEIMTPLLTAAENEIMTPLLTAAKNGVIEMVKKISDDGEKMTPLLTAAKNGVIEMVTKILKHAPLAIHETTADMKNILLVAVENRQPSIFWELKNHHAWESLIQAVDDDGNSVLHLAAQVSQFRPWRIAGSAMQMQSDIKFFEFVQKKAPKNLIFQTNNKEEIPSDIFTKSRKQIVKDSSEWLKSTSESCSVVAALIAGVSFATSCTVPGGTNSVTGKPTLEGEPAFDTFAITSLISLCFSVTALVMFLAILTSRQQPKDYRWDLPLKLLFGLSFLFASIVSMLFSFYAAYFSMLKDRIHNVLFIIYAATCLPMSVYAVAQFPLYWDLLSAIVTKVPQSAHVGHLYMNIDAKEGTSKK